MKRKSLQMKNSTKKNSINWNQHMDQMIQDQASQHRS